jgi:hypothetical protein
MNETKQRLRSASGSTLPVASIIPDADTFQQVRKLLAEAVKVKVKQSELEDREREIRDELAAVCEAYQLKGFRHGRAGFEYHGYTTRKTLSKEKLLAAGIPAETISDCLEESKPFILCKVVTFDID